MVKMYEESGQLCGRSLKKRMSDQDFQLCWGQHQQDTVQALKSLWQSEEFLDVTLACDDDQVQAHKVILSAASPFFRQILNRNPHSHPLLYIKGTTKKEMQALLNFIYSGETSVVQDELDAFMALAISLEIRGLIGDRDPQEPTKPIEETKKKRSLIKNENEPQIARPENKGIDKNIHQKLDNILGGRFSQEKEQEWFQEMQKMMKKTSLKTVKNSQNKNDNENKTFQSKIVKVKIKSSVSPSERKEEDMFIIGKDNRGFKSLNTISMIEEEIIGQQSNSFRKANDSGSCLNTSNTLMNESEYDEEVSALVMKSGPGWGCTECPYNAKQKSHVSEHVEGHIKGFTLPCKFCDKIFSMKRNLRHHVRKCKQNIKKFL